MPEELLTVRQAAARLGLSPATLYDWLGRSDAGLLVLRGADVTVDYYQTGPAGGGRIRIPEREVARLLDCLRVLPRPARPRRPPTVRDRFPGITVPLGRPGAPGP